MRILFVGDIYMAQGRKAFDAYFEEVRRKYRPNMVIVNGENIANGNGLTEPIYKDLMKSGVGVVTLGNHAYSQRDALTVLEHENVVRPANYGGKVPGNPYTTIRVNDKTITVINLLGRVFMHDQVDNPFTKMDDLLSEIKSDYILVDFHAEATSEKAALGHYLDGRVNAVIGTHTHIPTADAMILPKGTLYITDVGMTGAKYAIIGGEIAQGIRKFITGVPERTKPELEGPLQFNAVFLDLELKRIEHVHIVE
ncbi:MAG: TIGR00282 family metallophosphoesterase [Candidatus Izemoplasmatales bacterium]